MADDPRGALLAENTGFARRPAGDFARLVLRGREPALQAAFAALGMQAPSSLRARQSNDYALLWLGPDEYLLLAPVARADELTERLEQATQPYPHSLVCIADRQVGIELSGAAVEAVLNAGCPLDLSQGAFPVGMCTRTLLGKAEIVLWRIAKQRFHIEVWRSFAPYVEAFLDQAARDG